MTKYKTKLSSKLHELRHLNEISDMEHRRLFPTSTLTPLFYGLHKVHKHAPPPIMASRGSITCGVAPSRKERVCHKENHRHGELPQQLYPTGSLEIIHNRLESGQKLAYPTSMTAAHNRDLLLVRLKIKSFPLWQSHLLPSRSCRHVAPQSDLL